MLSIKITDVPAVPTAVIVVVVPIPTGADDIRRSECFLNPPICANESTGSLHELIPTKLFSEYAKF